MPERSSWGFIDQFKASALIRRGDIELDSKDLDGAFIQFDDIPDRIVLVAKSGQPYALNETHYYGPYTREGASGKRDFSVWPIEIQITGRRVGYLFMGDRRDRTLRVKVIFHQMGGDLTPQLGLLIFGDNEGRLADIDARENLDYRVRPRIEDVEEFGE